MSQFLLLAYDAKDALPRRQATRAQHLAYIEGFKASGNIFCGMALTDEQGTMIGSLILADFPDRAAFDAYLAGDPYRQNAVWERITVHTGALAPSFQHLLQHPGVA